MQCEACKFDDGNWWHLWGCKPYSKPTVVLTEKGPQRIEAGQAGL